MTRIDDVCIFSAALGSLLAVFLMIFVEEAYDVGSMLLFFVLFLVFLDTVFSRKTKEERCK